MTHATPPRGNLTRLDDATRALVRLSAVITAGSELEVCDAFANTTAPPEWIEELVLQTYLFAGFPRALNAMREWRRIRPQPVTPAPTGSSSEREDAGER